MLLNYDKLVCKFKDSPKQLFDDAGTPFIPLMSILIILTIRFISLLDMFDLNKKRILVQYLFNRALLLGPICTQLFDNMF